MLDAALAQLPVAASKVIARADSAGMSHGFLDGCRQHDVRFIVGHQLKAEIAKAVVAVEDQRWRPAVTADGTEERETGQVTELTGLVDLSGWPEGTRMIARREEPHPGAQLRPSASFAINQAWIVLVGIAQDLLAWTKALTLAGDLARAEPKRLRYCLLHAAGQIITTGRRRTLRLPNSWPWATQLVTAFKQLIALPRGADRPDAAHRRPQTSTHAGQPTPTRLKPTRRVPPRPDEQRSDGAGPAQPDPPSQPPTERSWG